MTKDNFSLKACVGVVLTSTVSQCLFDISWEGSLGPVIQFTLSPTVNCGLFSGRVAMSIASGISFGKKLESSSGSIIFAVEDGLVKSVVGGLTIV